MRRRIVTISNLYSNDCGKCKKKNKLNEDFELPNFKQLIFENYPFEIFEGKVSFYINGEKLKREDFFLETPKLKTVDYTDVDDNNLKVNLYFHKKYPELVDFKTKSKLTLQKLEKGKNKQLGI